MPALQAWIFGPLILCLNANRGQELGKVIRALKFIPVTSIFAGCLVLFPPCCLGSPSAVPRAVDDQSIASDITIQPGGGVEMLNPTTACYNFGQVSLPVAQPIRTDFILKSTARTTITVDHITASCPRRTGFHLLFFLANSSKFTCLWTRLTSNRARCSDPSLFIKPVLNIRLQHS